MAPRYERVVHPGFASNLKTLKSKMDRSSLISRATKRKTNAGGIAFIVVLVLIAVSIIFCAIIVFVILRNKRKRRQRQRKMEETRPMVAHEYRQLDDMESVAGGPQELPPENQINDTVPFQRAELQSDVNEIPKVQQLDGYAAPPPAITRPVELPPNAHPPTYQDSTERHSNR